MILDLNKINLKNKSIQDKSLMIIEWNIKRIEEKPELIYDTDYKQCSRAQIYKRDQKNIKSNNDFGRMLRFNDFKNDNLSFNKAYLTIAARYDLDQNKTYC